MKRLLGLLAGLFLLAAAPAHATVACSPSSDLTAARAITAPSGKIYILNSIGCTTVSGSDLAWMETEGFSVFSAFDPLGITINVTALPYSADPTGVSDSTSAINAALAYQASSPAGLPSCVYVPSGTYKVTGPLVMGASGCIYGDGRTKSSLAISSTSFTNLGVLGVLVLPNTSGSFGPTVSGIGFLFSQPQVSARASIVAFPPAIYMQGAGRVKLTNLLISGSNTCIDARGNTGGGFFDNIECGALTTGLLLDGAFDGVHVHGFHFWDFGITGLLQTNVYSDGTTQCMNIGRVDSLMMDDGQCFYGNVVLTANAGNSAGRLQFVNMAFDSSLWQQAAGPVEITNAEWVTGTNGPTGGGGANWGPQIAMTGGAARIHNFWISGAAAGASGNVSVTGGHLELHGGFLRCATPSVSCASVTTGFMGLYDVTYEPNFGSTWTVPFVSQNGGNLFVHGGWMDTPSNVSGSGSAITFATDSVNNYLEGFDADGWPVNQPVSPLLGQYWPNEAGLSVTSSGTNEAKVTVVAPGAAPADIYFGVNGNNKWVAGANASNIFTLGYPGTTLLQATTGNTVSVTGGGVFGIPQAAWPDNQACTAGQISVDASFIYVCTAANTVKRAALSAF